MYGNTDREVADASHQIDEVRRMTELAGRQVQVLRGVAAERKDVVDPGRVIARDDLGQLRARVGRTCEMCHRGERGLAVDARDDVVRHLACRTSGAVGHRHE